VTFLCRSSIALRIAISIGDNLSILYALITTSCLEPSFKTKRVSKQARGIGLSHLHRIHSTTVVDLNADSPGSVNGLAKSLPFEIVG
jgi:hypothetical protein